MKPVFTAAQGSRNGKKELSPIRWGGEHYFPAGGRHSFQVRPGHRLATIASGFVAMPSSDQTLSEELERFRTRCFWWVAKNVPLIELPRETLLKGLRTHGGREGMLLAARL